MPTRIHGAFVADEEVLSVVNFVKGNAVPEYDDSIMSDSFSLVQDRSDHEKQS